MNYLFIFFFIGHFWHSTFIENVKSPIAQDRPVVHIKKLIDIFGEAIVFNDICGDFKDAALGSQTVSSQQSDSTYNNLERIYNHHGNEINIKFHFYHDKSRLYQDVWESYLMHDVLNSGENMFIQVSVIYNGENHVNARLKSRMPLWYDVYSEVEMNHIDYTITPVEQCSWGNKDVINIEANLTGLIYNECGNMAIDLEGVRLKFQVPPFDTTQVRKMASGGKVYKPELPIASLTDEMDNLIERFDDVMIGESYDLTCIKWKGQPFILLNKPYMIFRLPEASFNKALQVSGTRYFNPGCRETPLEGWIQVPARLKEEWATYADEAYMYVKQ